jgi:L-alanine-DL-glutamate epimerase-like enolase superfamily enzyme
LTKSPIGVPVYRYWVARFALKSKLTQPAFTGENLAIRFDIWLRRRQVTSPKASMLEEDVAATRAVRSAIGADVALMVDANHAYYAVDAIQLGPILEFDRTEHPIRQAVLTRPLSMSVA